MHCPKHSVSLADWSAEGTCPSRLGQVGHVLVANGHVGLISMALEGDWQKVGPMSVHLDRCGPGASQSGVEDFEAGINLGEVQQLRPEDAPW